MIALDAGVLSLMIYSNSAVPKDFKTGMDIEHARERIDALIKPEYYREAVLNLRAATIQQKLGLA